MTGAHNDAETDEDMPPPVLIDCHTHLDGFPDDEVGEILGRAAEAGIGAVITAGTTLASSERAVWLAERFPSLFAGVGIHPTELTGPVDDATYARLAELVRSDRVLVVSEIGLDFQDTSPDRAVQFQGFRRQIGLPRVDPAGAVWLLPEVSVISVAGAAPDPSLSAPVRTHSRRVLAWASERWTAIVPPAEVFATSALLATS